MPELLLVGVGTMGRPYLDAARRLGVRVHAVESAAQASTLAGVADRVTPARGDGDEAWAEAAAGAAATARPDGVVAFTEPHVLGAALVAERLSLPGPSLAAAVLSRNKALQRGRCAAAGVRQPEYVIAGELAAVADWAESHFPVVVKPLAEAGSVGVELVPDRAAFEQVARRRRGERPLLVEAAVEGPEYSWEALVRDSTVLLANLTAKETTGPPHFVETGHRIDPLPVDPATARAIDELATAVLAALGMRTGIVHLELRLAATGPTLIEVAVRTPGDFLMDALSCAYGVDWHELVVRLALRLPLPELPRTAVAHAALHFPLAEAGTVVAIDGLDRVRADPAVQRAGVLVAEGDVLAPVTSSYQRYGFALLCAPDRSELERGLAVARRALTIRTSH